ncbi:hydroquinone glucosyltransferase-like [Tasmannia lanceolata]|uniref:hydroquinone glucosyltransferase-like n=1 Tax=Tasmannia lanceolata TaxID=3420 RepID=UPI004064BB06
MRGEEKKNALYKLVHMHFPLHQQHKRRKKKKKVAAMATESQQQQQPHIAILPSPGMGHLIPLAELAKRLVLHNFSVTFISLAADSSSKAQDSIVNALPKNVNSICLPPISLEDTPPNTKIETLISLTVSRSLPSLRNVLKALKSTTHLVALVVDLFAAEAFDVAGEFGISPFIFFPSTAMLLSLVFHLPTLDATWQGEYRDLPEPVKLPGCYPVHGKDLLDPVQDRQDDAYCVFLHLAERFKYAKGILINSFWDMEPGAIKALTEQKPGIPPLYPVGPLIQTGSRTGSDESECLKWLDEQPPGSVLFISFGSGGTLSLEQLTELALGLDMSEQRFLWVVRTPHEKEANATFFSSQSIKDPFDFLPKGFLDRTKGVGLVVPDWAPQIQVLSHVSTGGFLTHCGWNSTLESVVHGVPLIGWPLYAEQKMNAVILVEDLKVALRPKANENGLVGRLEIARVVKGLMEGEEGKGVRSRMRDLKDGASRVLAEEGSSYKALSEVARQWKSAKIV